MTRKYIKAIYAVIATLLMSVVPAFASAENAADAVFETVIETLARFVTIGGALWAVWGMVVLGTGLKDHNGPGIQSGVWQIVGGGLILAAAQLFKTVVL